MMKEILGLGTSLGADPVTAYMIRRYLVERIAIV